MITSLLDIHKMFKAYLSVLLNEGVPFTISSFCSQMGSSLMSFTSSSVDKCILGGTKAVEGK